MRSIACSLEAQGRSPDLQVIACWRPSRFILATVAILNASPLAAYSGATVRDFHPLPFSLAGLRRAPQTKRCERGITEMISQRIFYFCQPKIEMSASYQNRNVRFFLSFFCVLPPYASPKLPQRGIEVKHSRLVPINAGGFSFGGIAPIGE